MSLWFVCFPKEIIQLRANMPVLSRESSKDSGGDDVNIGLMDWKSERVVKDVLCLSNTVLHWIHT